MALDNNTTDRSQDTTGTVRRFWTPTTEDGAKLVQPMMPISAEALWVNDTTSLAKYYLFKASAGSIYEAFYANTDTQDLWFGLVNHNVGTDGEVAGKKLLFPWCVPAGRSGFYEWPAYYRFTTGCILACSTTANVVTLPASNVGVFHARAI